MTKESQPLTKAPRLMTSEERVVTFGIPMIQVGGVWTPSAKWEAAKLTPITVPWSNDGKKTKTFRCHVLAAPYFARLFDAWQEAKLMPLLLSFDGCWNPRMKRGMESSVKAADMSTHAFGAAIDINAQWNPLGKVGALPGVKGSVDHLVPIAEECGFFWGGDFKRRDDMHFELAAL